MTAEAGLAEAGSFFKVFQALGFQPVSRELAQKWDGQNSNHCRFYLLFYNARLKF